MKQIKMMITSLLSAAVLVVAGMLLTLAAPLPAVAEQCGSTGGPQDGGVETAIEVGCGPDENPIYAYAKGIIRFLAVLVGIVVVGAIVVGGIAYASARDDKAQVAKAIDIIRNAVVGLLLFIFMTAIINFLIPGGLFG